MFSHIRPYPFLIHGSMSVFTRARIVAKRQNCLHPQHPRHLSLVLGVLRV